MTSVDFGLGDKAVCAFSCADESADVLAQLTKLKLVGVPAKTCSVSYRASGHTETHMRSHITCKTSDVLELGRPQSSSISFVCVGTRICAYVAASV